MPLESGEANSPAHGERQIRRESGTLNLSGARYGSTTEGEDRTRFCALTFERP